MICYVSRWPAIAAMVSWRKATEGENIQYTWSDGNNVAWSRGSKGFFAISGEGSLSREIQTSMAAGTYCNIAQVLYVLCSHVRGKCRFLCSLCSLDCTDTPVYCDFRTLESPKNYKDMTKTDRCLSSCHEIPRNTSVSNSNYPLLQI